MQTQQFIRGSAEVVRVTALVKGDVYKRLEEATNYSEAKMLYGVVTDVLNNGSEAAIQAVEFTPSYGSVESKIRVFEVTQSRHLPDHPTRSRRVPQRCSRTSAVQRAHCRRSGDDCSSQARTIRDIVEGTLVQNLTTPATSNELPEAPTEEEHGTVFLDL